MAKQHGGDQGEDTTSDHGREVPTASSRSGENQRQSRGWKSVPNRGLPGGAGETQDSSPS